MVIGVLVSLGLLLNKKCYVWTLSFLRLMTKHFLTIVLVNREHCVKRTSKITFEIVGSLVQVS